MCGLGYTFVRPKGESPFCVRPDGTIICLVGDNYIPYLIPRSGHCKPCKPTGAMSVSCSSTMSPTGVQPGKPGAIGSRAPARSRCNTERRMSDAAPSNGELAEVDTADAETGHSEEQSALVDEHPVDFIQL